MVWKNFIVVEGMDGAGKSTLVENLGKAFPQAIVTHEPMEKCHTLEEFLEDRKKHWDKAIFPALANGKMVICDRFTDSTLAYQTQNDLSSEEWDALYDSQIKYGRNAVLTIVLVCKPEMALKRIEERGEVDGEWETLERLKREYVTYRILAVTEPLHILIDTTHISALAAAPLASLAITNAQQEIPEDMFHTLSVEGGKE